MDPGHSAVQERMAFVGCTYCGRTFVDSEELEFLRSAGASGPLTEAIGRQKTRDHVPSRAFLDEPFPPDLPVVECCQRCNNSFSQAERYLACLLECVVSGGTDPALFERAKVARTFQKRSSANLRKQIAAAKRESPDGLAWEMDQEHVYEVVTKLARGHVAFQEYPRMSMPTSISIRALLQMTELEKQQFETGDRGLRLLPELGSLAFNRIWKTETPASGWIDVQSNRYRYIFAVYDTCVSVRLVIRDYLACEVIWANE